MEFSKKLRILAGRHRFSQEQLAQKVGVSQNLVSLWTRGKSVPDLYEAARIASLFSVDVNYLADDDADEPVSDGLTEAEHSILKLLRALQLNEDEALRRLATAPPLRTHVETHVEPLYTEPTPGRTGGPFVGPTRFETEADQRREAERKRPAPAKKKEGKPKDVKGAKGRK